MEAATGELLVEVPEADGLAWVGDGRLAYWGREGRGLLDVASGSPSTSRLGRGDAERVHRPSRRDVVAIVGWTADRRPRVDLAGGPDPEPFIEVAGDVYSVTSTAKGRVLVTHDSDEGVVTTAYDRETAEPLVSGMPGEVVTALSPSGRLVGADPAGDITEFDLETLTRSRACPAPGACLDAAVRRQRLTHVGDGARPDGAGLRQRQPGPYRRAIPSSAPEGVVEAWLRPDGQRWRSTAASASGVEPRPRRPGRRGVQARRPQSDSRRVVDLPRGRRHYGRPARASPPRVASQDTG